MLTFMNFQVSENTVVMGSFWIGSFHENSRRYHKVLEDPETRAFLSRCFDDFWSLIPLLDRLHRDGFKKAVGKRDVTLKTFCRERFRGSFNKNLVKTTL